MNSAVYRSKVDWWIYGVVAVTVAVAFLGPIIDGGILVIGIAVGALLGILEVVMFASVKYQIKGNQLGVRNLLYKWEWFPIGKISEIEKSNGILSAPALSTKRISIRFSDRNILKSSMPLEISPADRDAFIAKLKALNPAIIEK